ncbi:CBS domain-containing protein [Myroides odoratimimus]|uniref:CBS domain-containing protein n=1 Tax=Myroides odoratimimus TaxID=76832 RepID=UPI0025764179|nr:CBS domain-containing protein [Myroides odoratimimus]MDM1465166.1 CBS domain-containing protein [Myroides odoratimimus]MDM1475153.1 CBS domain-containing protein [Myroides odoratimimus]
MTNADRFIDIYNNIETFLNKGKNIDGSYEGFVKKLRDSKHFIIKQNLEKLSDYAKLRNVIVHSPRTLNEKIIAQPTDEVVQDFELIYLKISTPIKVIPKFQFIVDGIDEDDKIDCILKTMREKSFSQFPVYDKQGYVKELISTNTISRWLAKNIENGDIIIESPKAQDLLSSIEFEKNYKFIPKDCDVYTAYQYFMDQIEKNNRNLDVLFITNSGKREEKLLGLITIEDIAAIAQK